jgi:endonuclease-3 related protein
MLLYALEKPIFVVDAYTKRILLRHRFIKENSGYQEVQNLFMQNLNPVTNSKTKHRKNTICNGVKNDVKLFNEYHALLVKLGKDFCLKSNPKCDICPLK